MRSRLVGIVSMFALLLVLNAQGLPGTGMSAHAQQEQDCTHPMRVGCWEGSFLSQLKVVEPDTGAESGLPGNQLQHYRLRPALPDE